MVLPKATNPVGAVKQVSKILNILKVQQGATAAEISSQTELSSSSIHNYLETLREEELVIKNGGKFYVSLKFLEFGTISQKRYELLDEAKSEVDELAEETGEMVNVLVEEYGRGVHLYRKGGENALKYSEYIGYRSFLHNSAAGKCILAYQPRSRIREIIEDHGLEKTAANTITNLEELEEELDEVRANNVAFDDEESLNGCRCVAAPITNKADQKVLGAISVSGPKRRMQGERFREVLPEKVKDAANVIEVGISYR